jgi:hypothetical protein
MGTRADFYIGRGKDAEWLGSIAMDGYPDGEPESYHIVEQATEEGFRHAVTHMLDAIDHATKPEQGWPWPWDDSGTTDYAYAFDGDMVWASGFGGAWFDASKPQPQDEDDRSKVANFPDMKDRANVTMGKRSGLLVFGIK